MCILQYVFNPAKGLASFPPHRINSRSPSISVISLLARSIVGEHVGIGFCGNVDLAIKKGYWFVCPSVGSYKTHEVKLIGD
jgi:hypothetical protein